MRHQFVPGAKLVVIGAGYIGLESAAVARKLGLDVTVVETAIRPLARVTSPQVAGFFLDEHAGRGVRFMLSAQPAVIKGVDRVTGVALASGAEIPADIVIAGIGVDPDVALAQQAGLEIDNGVVTDRACRTADPAIFSIGDCARRPMTYYDNRLVRLESVHNAAEGARIVAAGILGQEPPHEEAPWFWSDQFDIKLQIAGLFQGYDKTVLRGTTASRSFAVFYYQGDRLIAVDAINRPAEYLGAKMLIQTRRSVAPDVLQNEGRPMKEIVAAAKA